MFDNIFLFSGIALIVIVVIRTLDKEGGVTLNHFDIFMIGSAILLWLAWLCDKVTEAGI